MYNLELNTIEQVSLILALRYKAEFYHKNAMILIEDDDIASMCVKDINRQRQLILKLNNLSI